MQAQSGWQMAALLHRRNTFDWFSFAKGTTKVKFSEAL